MPNVLERGQTIPDFTLPDAHGETVSSRSFYMRRNFVIALLPDGLDEAWSRWLARLQSALRNVPDGDAVCLIVGGDELAEVEPGESTCYLLVDRDRTIRSRVGVADEQGQLIITDRYGVIFHVATGYPVSPELAPDEVPGWVEFIACRCS